MLLSALEIVFGTNKEILFRERRPGREGTWRRISSDRYVGALSWTHFIRFNKGKQPIIELMTNYLKTVRVKLLERS